MTPLQKQIILLLLKGMYMMRCVRHDRKTAYKIYRGNMIPVMYVNENTVRSMRKEAGYELFKTDKKKHITLHLSNIRRMHGASWMKQQYKLSKTKL